jgi:hypothetical protein
MNGSNLYRVFLLRLWREHDPAAPEPAPLRIVVEKPGDGERISFPTLQAMLIYLEAEMGQEPDNDP